MVPIKKANVLSTIDLKNVPEAIKALTSIANLVQCPPDRNRVLGLIGNIDVYFASASIVVDEEFLEKAPRLKLIGTPSTGTDHLDKPLIANRGITIYDISKEIDLISQFTATSELAFGLILSLVRKLIPASNAAKSGYWARENFSGFQLYGKTLGIIGLGRLGKISANIGNGFGMRVVGYDPFIECPKNVERVSFDELLSIADIVTIHVHLTKETENLIGDREFNLMKDSAILINTSRGKIVNETSLLRALKRRVISGAGLDVIDGEWLSMSALNSHPLIEYSRENDNLIIVPHIGGSTEESIKLARIFMAQKIVTYLENKNI